MDDESWHEGYKAGFVHSAVFVADWLDKAGYRQIANAVLRGEHLGE